ncbi:unnamed protein product [Nyctereutes procyonoides]|uniref:(raccoon dog) hypothetical protein n=1 Tax=Nyctereutes procyonoides TaxID=34880 RepID=A0A811ZNF1_NYCPR|nr:unnamed protein product [Nyctereutes procyonoides]
MNRNIISYSVSYISNILLSLGIFSVYILIEWPIYHSHLNQRVKEEQWGAEIQAEGEKRKEQFVKWFNAACSPGAAFSCKQDE